MSDGRSAPAGAPPTNMGIAGASLGVGLFCGGLVGMIPGILAIIQANKVTALYTAGDVAGATEASAKAKRLAVIGFVLTAIVFVLIVGLNIVTFTLSDS